LPVVSRPARPIASAAGHDDGWGPIHRERTIRNRTLEEE
jgi:hypothetical protein